MEWAISTLKEVLSRSVTREGDTMTFPSWLMSRIWNPEGVKAVLRAPQSAVGGDFLRRRMSTRLTWLE
jgi:hypothetical protein